MRVVQEFLNSVGIFPFETSFSVRTFFCFLFTVGDCVLVVIVELNHKLNIFLQLQLFAG